MKKKIIVETLSVVLVAIVLVLQVWAEEVDINSIEQKENNVILNDYSGLDGEIIDVKIASVSEASHSFVDSVILSEPDYIYHIPNLTKIDSTISGLQELEGTVYVTTLDNNCTDDVIVICHPTTKPLVKTDDEVIIETHYFYQTNEMENPREIDENTEFDCELIEEEGFDFTGGTRLFIQVPEKAWEEAPNGKYYASVSFDFEVISKI